MCFSIFMCPDECLADCGWSLRYPLSRPLEPLRSDLLLPFEAVWFSFSVFPLLPAEDPGFWICRVFYRPVSPWNFPCVDADFYYLLLFVWTF
ncbi:hypothetical protein NPIL_592201 [Nephila pilipes]|uniref:Uncharacterized protein n=1 Tax=Nephila pilipes TaxID=299642 RepID=A0A8X6N098_NEPPI|nr:hypothetical protein NPIL_592201 [Nephila pilipes]